MIGEDVESEGESLDVIWTNVLSLDHQKDRWWMYKQT